MSGEMHQKRGPSSSLAFALLFLLRARALRVGPGRVLLTLRKPGTPCQLAGILEGVLQL